MNKDFSLIFKNFLEYLMIAACFLLAFLYFDLHTCAREISRDSVQNEGIVYLHCRLSDGNSQDYGHKYTTGFLMSKDGDVPYIVAAKSEISFSQAEKEEIIQTQNLQADVSLTEEYYVIFKRDTEISLEMTAMQSDIDNFCVFQCSESKLEDQKAVTIDEKGKLKAGDPVYMIGYGVDSEKIVTGKIKAKIVDKVSIDKTKYIQFDPVTEFQRCNGVLTDKDGYVIGLVNGSLTDDNYCYALPVGQISHLFDNDGISYQSKQIDSAKKTGLMRKLIYAFAAFDILMLFFLIKGLITRFKLGKMKKSLAQESKEILTTGWTMDRKGNNLVFYLQSDCFPNGRFLLRNDMDNYSIGRDKDECDIFIPMAFVSRKHASLMRRNDRYYIMDYSKNGTYVNQRRIPFEKMVALSPGDVIRLGEAQMVFGQMIS